MVTILFTGFFLQTRSEMGRGSRRQSCAKVTSVLEREKMGTSNWQNIPFCVEALMKIEPKRVLDVGVGFGRWGMIVREFCDVWYGRVPRKDWKIHIEGVEAFADSITGYHHSFYDKIHIADAREILPSLFEEQWDVVIFGDVLEHFEKNEAIDLLNKAIESSAYVLLNVPLGSEWPQEEVYDNPYERHLSEWDVKDFQGFALRQQAFFRDYIERPFGSFVFSKSDPKGLAHSLFSKNTVAEEQPPTSDEALLSPIQQQLLAQVNQLAHELKAIKNSYTWRFGQKIALSPLGLVALRLLRVTQKLRSFVIRSRAKKNSKITRQYSTRQAEGPARFSVEEKKWLERTCAHKLAAIAVLHPDWRGIRSATLNLFSAYRFVDDTLDEPKALHIAQLLAETGCERVALSGFPISHRYLATVLHKIAPQIKVYVLWHGSFLHAYEDYAWQAFHIIQGLCQDGLIYKWGFVKKGMAEIIAAQIGIRTGFVMNYVRNIPEKPSNPMAGGPHIGLFSLGSLWKLPYAVLAAVSMIPEAKLHLSGAPMRIEEFLNVLHIRNAELIFNPIPQEKMPEVLAQMHLNMNISLTECTPMVPLESLSVGVPCLVSATSHLFEDHTYLRERLIVTYHERAEIIGEYALRAIAERDDIVLAYREYVPEYNARAQASLAEFLEI
jgi:glycosyltransferase involved in cell wall biosynthesis